ncbi:MAG: hypothetical protein JW809_03935 [Pirellulales bacterium]|nr:hypothetical protein [Pirellulales bacterium]
MWTRPFRTLVPISASVVLAIASIGAQQPQPTPTSGLVPAEGVLVLSGGQVLSGRIVRAGDLYLVALPHGEIRVRAGQVVLHCASLDEAYQRQRAAIGPGGGAAHVDLAKWCLRHGLLDAAARELADAATADPSHPMIPLVTRQLEFARATPGPPQSAGNDQAAAAGPTLEEIDSLIRTLPPGAMTEFASTIQPILVRRCASGGCHGPQTTAKLSLLRLHPDRPVSKRVTQRNLHAVVQWVDRAQPAASPLLQVPMRPHGTAEEAVFTERDEEDRDKLAQWVNSLALLGQPVDAGAARHAGPSLARPTSATGELPSEASHAPPGIAATPTPFDIPPIPAGRQLPTRSPARRGGPLPKFVPADPFDPEIFNRRYSPDNARGPSS